MQWSSRVMLRLLIVNILDREEKIMVEWLKTALIDIVELIGGGTPKTSKAEYWGGNINWLSVKDFNNENRYVYSTEKTITEEGLNNSSTKLLKKDDIIISARGTVGELAMIPFPMAFNQSCYGIRAKEGIDSIFLYYLIKNSVRKLKAITHGSVFDTITRDTFANIEVAIPDIKTQHRIAKMLADIDDKVENNQRINNNLLQQLHVLYLRLFCESAMDTPLGNVVATTSGGTPSRKHDEYYSDSSICWVKSKELLGNYIHETEEHINDLAIKKSSAKLLPEHSVLIAMYGATVGAYGVISKPMTCNQAVCALLCNENYPYTYLFQIAYESQQKFINLAVGSAQQNISQVLIKQLNLHSDLDIIQRFHDLALPMHQEIEFLQAENIRLSDLRDNLLPKLMSGELDVSNIDL